jgi:hypothetical protein
VSLEELGNVAIEEGRDEMRVDGDVVDTGLTVVAECALVVAPPRA